MKQRFIIGSVPVLMRPGWNPDAFTVLNYSDQAVYVREGAADSGVGAGNYDYAVAPGGSLTFPTAANNFSAVQAVAADRPAIILLWDRAEVAPSFSGFSGGGGGGGGASGSGYAFGTLAPDSATALALTVPAGTPPVRAVVGPVEGQAVRFRYDGGVPTATVGQEIAVGDSIILDTLSDIQNARFIATAGVASIPYTLER